MVGRPGWRRSALFAGGIALTASILFIVDASTTVAESTGLMSRLRGGIRVLAGGEKPFTVPGAPRVESRSGSLMAIEADQRARDPYLIQWGNVFFDPLKGIQTSPGLPAEMSAAARELPRLLAMAPGDVDYWIVQYDGAAGPARDMLEKIGVDIVAVVPNSAYLVRADDASIRMIQQEPMVRWTGHDLPAWKLDGGVTTMMTSADASQLPLDPMGVVRLGIRLHPGLKDEEVDAYYDGFKEMGVDVLNVERSEGMVGRSMLVGVDPIAVKDFVQHATAMRDVAAIWDAQIPQPFVDQAIWFLQSGNDQIGTTDYNRSAPLFARGITGRGLLGAVADTGLEDDMCQFRYTGQKNDIGWVQGPSAGAANPVPDEESLDLAAVTPAKRTRERKVVAYYVQQGAQAYSDTVQHGTTVSGCMLADNYSVLAARPLVRDVGERQNVIGRRGGGVWTLGQELRPELTGQVDDPTMDDPSLPNTFGFVEHHQSKDGNAPGAQLVFQDIANSAGTITATVTTKALYEQASRTGATVHNASYGGGACTSCYVGDGQDADDTMYYRRDFLGFAAAGNQGSSGRATIGDGISQGKTVMCVGWSIQANAASCPPCPLWSTVRTGQGVDLNSSRGPATAGMLAPKICAPGYVLGVASDGNPSPNPEDGSGTSDGGCGDPTGPSREGGTSFASPDAAGAGLLVEQYFMDGFYPTGVATPANALRPTNALVSAILVNSTRDMLGSRTDDTGTSQQHRPSFGQGWGAPRLDDTLYFQNDPKRGNPTFETERAHLAVLTDTPNGFNGTLAPEPGGKTRDQIVNGFSPALGDRTIHEWRLDVINDSNGDGVPDPDDLANELRFTLAWADVAANTNTSLIVNNLDLEVIGPGPNGTLESDDVNGLRGDDVVYRTNPNNAWSGGYSVPSTTAQMTTSANIATPWSDTDLTNTVENVFIKSQDVVRGTYLIRVIARSVRGAGGTSGGWPNFDAADAGTAGGPNDTDTDGDGLFDADMFDTVRGSLQGYALIASGNFTTDQGALAMNKSTFGCEGEVLTLSLNDRNGGSSNPPCTGGLTAVLHTTTPGPSFPEDREDVRFVGSAPTYRSQNPVTGADGFPIVLVRDPGDVVLGDGIIQIAHGETVIAEYTDNAPCGGRAFAQAIVTCQPNVQDQGFLIADGCDYAAPGDPNSGTRPDQFMDRGELNRYTVFVSNAGATTLTDAVVSLYPDPTDPFASDVHVLDSPQYIGNMPPGRIDDRTFLVQVGNLVPPQHSMDFIVEVTSPRDGLLFPYQFRQTQVMEADVVSFRYDTRDPNAELYKQGRIEVLKPGVTAIPGGNPASDYVTNSPMWWDPDTNVAANCNVPRDRWIDRYTPPAACTANSNPIDPWDFDDSEEQWQEAVYDGDTSLDTVDFGPMWFWKAAPSGGGCGWENQLHDQLSGPGVADPLPSGHPDRFAQPWGIWHTGEINNVNAGPYAGDSANTDGVPFYDNPDSPNDHTIMWDPPPPGGADNNATGQWCNTYLSSRNLGTIYRSMLMPPRLYRVHSNPIYRVEFQSFKWYTRLDAHTIDPNNLAAFGWMVHNQPVDPTATYGGVPAYTWDQFQYVQLIYSDKVREHWNVDDNDLGDDGLSHPNEDFQYLTYEDIYGPAADSWNIAMTFAHISQDGRVSKGQYGAGVDDVSFVWTESRDDADGSNCGALPNGQRPIIWFGENRYNACSGTLDINLWAPAETRDPLAVAVTSAAEDYETAILHYDSSTGRYHGTMDFTTDRRDDAVGVLVVAAGSIDIGQGADTISVEYDPNADDDLTTSPQDRADWCDTDNNGINDDFLTNGTTAGPPDGIPDCEDDTPANPREVRDFSVINCTSGRLFYIKSELQQDGPGDGDRFADPGEQQKMKVYLVSGLAADLENVTVRISSNDPVSISSDTVHIPLLPANGTVVDTGFGFEFCVPLGMTTTDINNPRTLTFRIDVTGTDTSNLNEFSTAGDSFNSFLPLEAWMLVDVDTRATTADYRDTVQSPVPPTGTFFEGFNNDPTTSNGFDHQLVNGFSIGEQVVLQSTTGDPRFGQAGNKGFCPECDVQDDCSVDNGVCDHYFSTDPAFTPGYDLSLDSPWNQTQDWAHEGTGSYKFGKLNAGPGSSDQHYPQGVYASVQFPPLRIASDATQPEIQFWNIANAWTPFFTSGLFTPIDGFVIEIAPSAVGVGDTGGGDDRLNRSNTTRIANAYPLASFRRVSPYSGVYDFETDALNACRALFCRYKHPVFATQGSPTTSPASNRDPEAGVAGTVGTWKLSKVDLSDFRSMEIVIQFSAEVLEDLEVQNGNMGWFIDQVSITGVSNRIGIQRQTNHLTTEACGLVADFSADDPGCFGSDIQFYDRHSGVGAFDTSVTPSVPFPIRYHWTIGSLTLDGMGGALITPPQPGVYGTYDNPRVNLQAAANVTSPGRVPVTLELFQNGSSAGSVSRTVVYKDAPVPVLDPIGAAYVGGLTQLSATATFNASLDPTRTLYWQWDFGDGTGADASGASVQHQYDAAGTYPVTVTVYDEEGCQGTATANVTVTAAPSFANPRMTPAADPDCGTPNGNDNNADIEELITTQIQFDVSPGAGATGVIGYLTSPDPLVDVVTGVADFGAVPVGSSPQRTFRFIRHDDGTGVAPTCLVVPFQLTLVANGGAVIQVLDLSFTMGNASFSSFDNVGTQTGSFTRQPTGNSSTEVSYTSPAGCLTGLELDMDVTATPSAVVGDLKVDLISPDNDVTTVQFANGPNDAGPMTLHFRFGANNAQPPIADTAGQLEQIAPTILDPTVASTIVSDLVGKSMLGTWKVRISTARPGPTTLSYGYTIREFRLEGTNSADLQVGTPLDCSSACFSTGAAPVFAGPRTECPSRVVFPPADDAFTCDGNSDVTYELWASTTAGQLGHRVDGTSSEIADCAGTCPAGDGSCAEINPANATFWDVCNTSSVYWTVIAVDGRGQRTPNIGATSPSTENPGAFQTALLDPANCIAQIAPVTEGVFSILKTGSTTATAWLVPPPSHPTWALSPPPNADEYRILRGTFPTASGSLAVLGTRTPAYNHVARPGDCSFTTTTRDVSSDLTLPGSYYYLIPGVNARGCGGMGYDSEGGAIPGNGTGCAVAPDCSP